MSKKLIALLLAAMMMLSLAAACGNKTPADIDIATLTPTVVYNEELCSQLGITVGAN